MQLCGETYGGSYVAGYQIGGCQLNLSIVNWISGQSSLRCHRHGLPFRHRLVAENAERASGDEMTLDVKQIVNGTVS